MIIIAQFIITNLIIIIIISSIATSYTITYIIYIYTYIHSGRSHIPYRNSMMTSVLRDSLGGNCKTIMIATINPEASHTEESLTTCKFAQRVSLIKNKALINEEMDPSIVIRRLKNELLTLREEIAYLKGENGEGDILSPQQVDELQVQCREYCYDMNPESVLNIGTLTLTKIKDAFAIMKNLVLEALNKNNNTNNGSNNYDDDGGGKSSSRSRGMNVGGIISEDVKMMNKQVSDLKALLLQRDNEIAILVNMVKKGKTVEDVGMSVQRSSRVGSHDTSATTGTAGGGRRNRDEEEEDHDRTRRIGSSNDISLQQQQQQQTMKPSSSSSSSNNNNNKSYQQQQLELQRDREKETQELIIKRHLFGVSPPTTDLSILEDMSKSFDYFCSKCNLNNSLNENKEILKEKIAEAKASGERANHSRSTINYLKNSIEAIRRERILQKLSSNNNNDYKKSKSIRENSSDDNNDDKDHDNDEVDDVETEEEVTYRRAIDQEKVVYKESFDRLRVLKPEIENIRKVS